MQLYWLKLLDNYPFYRVWSVTACLACKTTIWVNDFDIVVRFNDWLEILQVWNKYMKLNILAALKCKISTEFIRTHPCCLFAALLLQYTWTARDGQAQEQHKWKSLLNLLKWECYLAIIIIIIIYIAVIIVSCCCCCCCCCLFYLFKQFH